MKKQIVRIMIIGILVSGIILARGQFDVGSSSIVYSSRMHCHPISSYDIRKDGTYSSSKMISEIDSERYEFKVTNHGKTLDRVTTIGERFLLLNYIDSNSLGDMFYEATREGVDAILHQNKRIERSKSGDRRYFYTFSLHTTTKRTKFSCSID